MDKNQSLFEMGQRIKNRRKDLGMSQQELAELVGYKSRSSINKIELGKNDILQSTIKKIASVLNCTPSYLMGRADEAIDPSNNPKTFENIKCLREKRGFSQEELATMVGYKDRSSIAKVEAGLVDLSQSKIAAFADALGVTPAQLMCIESTDGEPSPTKIRFNAFAETLSDEQMEKVMQIAKIALDR